MANLFNGLIKAVDQALTAFWVAFQQMKCHALSRLATHAGQTTQGTNQLID
jgi:hypothetical protein